MSERLILLVEDNPDDEELTRIAFRQNHILNELVVARDGAEALEYLMGGGELPALVLLDLKLPKVDGLEVLKRMRAEPRTALVPVVVLTSSREDQDLVESYRSGCNSYVRKPVDFGEFLGAAKQLGMYWLMLNEAVKTTRRGETAR